MTCCMVSLHKDIESSPSVVEPTDGTDAKSTCALGDQDEALDINSSKDSSSIKPAPNQEDSSSKGVAEKPEENSNEEQVADSMLISMRLCWSLRADIPSRYIPIDGPATARAL